MNPLALGLAAVAAVAAYKYKDKLLSAFGKTPEAPVPAGGPVEKLEKGRTYTVMAVINKEITNDPRWNTSNQANTEKIPQLIAATFGQYGFQVLNKPLIRNGQEMQKAIAGEPSTWVFNGRWGMDDDHVVAQTAPWLSGASFYLVPTA